MNVLKVYKDNKLIFNDNELENGKYSIGSDGILEVSGDMIVSEYAFENVYDKEFLEKVRDCYIQKTWILKRDYLPSGWFEYKQTKKVAYTTSNYIVKDFSNSEEIRRAFD